MTARPPRKTFTASHWGVFEAERMVDGTALLKPWQHDPDPPLIGYQRIDEDLNRLRIRRPAVREGWLTSGPQGPKGRRGVEPFVEIDWATAADLVARELERIRSSHGNDSIFGGSYGWASAGRFHHAQSQIHRFLNLFGGYVRHTDSYSLGAGRVLMPHIISGMDNLISSHTSWDVMASETELFVAFGGVPAKNAQISSGGAGDHRVAPGLERMAKRGVRFVNIGPVNDNLDNGARNDWIPIRPGTDTALMLALAHTLYAEHLWQQDFIRTHTTGFDRFLDYLIGRSDGVAKTPEWAEAITSVPAAQIRDLARQMSSKRTMLNIAWSLQRAAHGEQPFWMLVTLACMLGQIGLPGGGFGAGYGTTNTIGSGNPLLSGPTLSQGRNLVSAFIPVARIADMLLNPGGTLTYNGKVLTYPDIKLIYWVGGNPFHHHQDLNRLQRAWQVPDTVIVHEQFWNPLAKAADIVLPATLTVERNDIGHAKREGVLVAMKQICAPLDDALDDHEIFRRIAVNLGLCDAFTEGRDEIQWLEHIYEENRAKLAAKGVSLPEFARFWEDGILDFRDQSKPVVMFEDFRNDPVAHPLPTPSGRIEIFSSTIASFGYEDCPGHPVWREPFEWLGGKSAENWPIHLISDQPRRRLHSQADHGRASRAGKIDGREPVYLNATDAADRGICDGDVVEIFNSRGRCLSAALLSDDLMRGVARLSTGAWFDPGMDGHGSLEKHGNPNAVTLDRGASSLSQGCAAQSCLVEIRKYDGVAPEVTAFRLPEFVSAKGR